MKKKGLWRATRRSLGKLIVAGVMVTSPLLARAQVSAPVSAPAADSVVGNGETTPWWREISTHGFLSLSYTYNTNDPRPRINQFRVFDFNDDDPQLDVAELFSFSPGHVSQHGMHLLGTQDQEPEQKHDQYFRSETHDSPLGYGLVAGNGGWGAGRLLIFSFSWLT